MTLKEAIKSGMPYKRPKHSLYYKAISSFELKTLDNVLMFRADDILATDWETGIVKVAITEIQIKNAIEKCSISYNIDFDELFQELGFRSKK